MKERYLSSECTDTWKRKTSTPNVPQCDEEWQHYDVAIPHLKYKDIELLFVNGNTQNHLAGGRQIGRIARVAQRYPVNNLLTLNNSAEDRVLLVQPGCRRRGDEELRTGTVWVRRACHSYDTGLVEQNLVGELCRDGIAGATGAIAAWVATLSHKVGQYPMPGQAIVEVLAGQEDEVVHRLGRNIG